MWTLVVKVECFLLMVAISAYHAFYLRLRLVEALAQPTVVAENTSEHVLVQVAPASASRKPTWLQVRLKRLPGYEVARVMGTIRSQS